MLKFLILFPLLVLGIAFGGALLLPLLLLAPVLLIAVFAIALPLLILRLLAGLVFGLGGLFFGLLGGALALGAALFLIVFGVLAAHLLLPILLIVGLVWLIRRAAKPAPVLHFEHPAR